MLINLKIVIFFLIIISLISSSVSACTGFTVTQENKTLVGSNEDWWDPDTYIRVYPPENGKYGRLILTNKVPIPWNPNYINKGCGVNDQGLFYDKFNHPIYIPIKSLLKPLYLPLFELENYCLESCSTVEEIIDIFSGYNLFTMLGYQAFFVDRFGDSVIIEGDEIIHKQGTYQVVTNFLQSNPDRGWYPCWRYDTAVSMLDNMTELSVDYFFSICNATHTENVGICTQSSRVCNLNEGIIYISHLHNYDKIVELNLEEEFELGIHSYYLPSLFEPTYNQPPSKPSRPIGEIEVSTIDEYIYFCNSSDFEGHQMYYMWDFGNGEITDWIGPYDSGKQVNISYGWMRKGSYDIRVKSKDIFGKESPWSDPLLVTVIKNDTPFKSLFLQFLKQHPLIFPILRHLMGL